MNRDPLGRPEQRGGAVSRGEIIIFQKDGGEISCLRTDACGATSVHQAFHNPYPTALLTQSFL